jgi:methionyl aminopeptidase
MTCSTELVAKGAAVLAAFTVAGFIMKSVTIENEADLRGIREAGRVVAKALAAMRSAVRPGITTRALDAFGAAVIEGAGARSAPQFVYGFPGVNLISVNDEVVHGVPGDRLIQAGDVVKLDVTAELNGYIADAAETVLVPPISLTATRLQRCAIAAFRRGAEVARAGCPVAAIGAAVERKVRERGFYVIRELSGHGVGRTIHEPPTVPNYGSALGEDRLADGMVITIEPLISTSLTPVFVASDGWTIRTRDGSLAAHHEHTIIVWRDSSEIVTRTAH